MKTKKFLTNIKNDNLDDVNLKVYEDENELNKDLQDKNNIEIIRRQEYLLQMKTEVKFPVYQILQKFNYIKENEEYKLCSKIRIDSSKKHFINFINNSDNNFIKNKNKDSILDISNEIYEEDLSYNKNDKENDFDYEDESEEFLTGYLFIFQNKIILTNNQIENLKKSLKRNPVLYSIKFSQFCIFRLIIHDTTQNELYLQFYDQSFSFKKDLMLKFLITRDSFCVHHFIKKYFILQWQIIFEYTIILNYKKLIYNRHFILLKYNKYGKCQERILLVTNGLLLNIKHDFKKYGLQFSIKNIQWAIGIKAIKKIELMIETNKENKLKIYVDKIVNNAEVLEFLGETKFLKFKEERNFEFYSYDERNDFVGLMRRNYYLLTNKFIKLDCYPPLNKKKLGNKTTIESSIFDSSFESSEEEQKLNDNNENIEKKEKVKKEDNSDNDNIIIINEIKDEENHKDNKEEEEKIKIINNGNEAINNEDIKNNKNNNEKKNEEEKEKEYEKSNNKNTYKNIDEKGKNKNKDNIEKIINNKTKVSKKEVKKGLKKTKKSIFDENYNSIFDSDYESEDNV